MNISENGLKFICEFEGFSEKAYICAAGKRTIGYGHVIKPHERFSIISQQEAIQLLKNDVKIAENAINDLVIVELNQNQFNSLVSFVFNVGVGAFKQSTMLRKINLEKFQLAADEFTRWVYVSGVVHKGLVRRRAIERQLFLL